jgi:hypothetical protein
MGPEKGKQRSAPNAVEHRADGTTVITLDYKGQPLACVVDTADFPLVSMHTWSPSKSRKTFYAVRTLRINGKPTIIRMQNLIMVPASGQTIDHRDRNGLNNRRFNLRSATRRQQQQNQKLAGRKFRGIGWNTENKCWKAMIRINGKNTYIGLFDTPEDAARAYDATAKKHHDEFAALNFPEEVLV